MKQNETAGNSKKRKNRHTDTDTDSDSNTDADTESNSYLKKKIVHTEKRECEREKQKICGKRISQQLLDIWNAEVQSKITKNQKAILTPKRKKLLEIRWKHDFEENIHAWQYYCEIIGNSDFCLGKVKGKSWTIDLTWAIASSDHVAKVLEGGFSGGYHLPKQSLCHVPEITNAWEYVLGVFETYHSKEKCRCWLGNTEVVAYENQEITLKCPSEFSKGWIKDHYLDDLCRWLKQATDKQSTKITKIKLITEVKS